MSGKVAGIGLAVAFGIVAVLVQLRPLEDVDMFTQVRLGLEALQSGSLLSRPALVWGSDAARIANPGWLAQIIYAQLYLIGGETLMRGFHAVLVAGAYSIAGYAALTFMRLERRRFGLISAAVPPLLGFLAGATNSAVRPQGIALFCFSILLFLALSARLNVRSFIAYLPVALIWQNSHPSLSLGVILVALIAIAECRTSFDVATKAPRYGAWIAGLCLLQVATPEGLSLIQLSARNLEIAAVRLQISEWQPPWHPSVAAAMAPFWLLTITGAAAAAWRRQSIGRHELLLFLGFGALTLSASRFSLQWGLAAVPFWSSALSSLGANVSPSGIRRSALGSIIALSLVGAGSLLTPPHDPQLPFAGIEALKRFEVRKIYNYREWAGPLVLYGERSWRVAIDGRLYLYSDARLESYYLTARGEIQRGDSALISEADALFLDRAFQRRLIEIIKDDSAWRLIHLDMHAAVFVRSGTPPNRAEVHPLTR